MDRCGPPRGPSQDSFPQAIRFQRSQTCLPEKTQTRRRAEASRQGRSREAKTGRICGRSPLHNVVSQCRSGQET